MCEEAAGSENGAAFVALEQEEVALYIDQHSKQ